MPRTRLVVASALAMAFLAVTVACAPSGSSREGTTTSPGGYGGGPATTGTPPATGAASAVSIRDFAFDPASLEVPTGTSVTWTNEDGAAHTIDGEGFSSGELAQGETYAFVFSKPGTYPYRCGIHPSMTGEVVVK